MVFGSDDARIWALDLYNGSLLWRYTTRSTIHGSPAIADINSDGRQEIVATCFDGNVYALNGDGTRLWMTTPSAGSRPIQASPAVGDINNDGRPEVVISTLEGMAYALAGADGKPLWNHTMGYTEKDYTALVPVITDLDGDGKTEVLVAGGLSGNLSCLSGQNGNLKWNRTLGQHLYSTPAVGDGDGDGRMEVYLFSGPMHFVALNGATGMGEWDHQFPTSVMDYSSPAMADIDGDGRPELVFGGVDRVLRALNAEDGSIAWAYPVPRRIESSPAIADIDRDGRAEVVFGCDDGRIYALDYNF